MAWIVLVEESEGLGRDRWRWSMTPFRAGPFADFDGAADAALRLTRDYRPQHPWSERNRSAYRVSPSEYIVRVAGATADFHFRVTVAEAIEPGTGHPV